MSAASPHDASSATKLVAGARISLFPSARSATIYHNRHHPTAFPWNLSMERHQTDRQQCRVDEFPRPGLLPMLITVASGRSSAVEWYRREYEAVPPELM